MLRALIIVGPGALKTFAAEPVAPNIKIRTFLHTDSVITCFVCCLLGIGTKIVKNHAKVRTLYHLETAVPSSRLLATVYADFYGKFGMLNFLATSCWPSFRVKQFLNSETDLPVTSIDYD